MALAPILLLDTRKAFLEVDLLHCNSKIKWARNKMSMTTWSASKSRSPYEKEIRMPVIKIIQLLSLRQDLVI